MSDQLSKRKAGPNIVKMRDGEAVERPHRMTRTHEIPDRITQDVIRSMRATQKAFDAIVAAVKLPPAVVRLVFLHSRRASAMLNQAWCYYGLKKHKHRNGRPKTVLCAECGGPTTETTDGLCCPCWMEVSAADQAQAAYLHRTVDCQPSDRRDERLFASAMSDVDAEIAARKAHKRAPVERTFTQIAIEAEQRFMRRACHTEGMEFDG